MTLDEFLRTLETLIDDQVQDEDPGEGNFGCQNCRACYSCRFCIGCDSCEDCTYCEESLDSTGCTQSKRCVGCERVSYCEDCRDCKASRYLTLCIDCTDCTHCLACVGLKGGEFYVLNQQRSRKEYFTLLRQIQDLVRVRLEVGWRAPTIGLSSEVSDPIVAGRDVELSTAPWLDDLFAEVDPELEAGPLAQGWTSPARDLDEFAAELEVDPELAMPARPRPSPARHDGSGGGSEDEAPVRREQLPTQPFQSRGRDRLPPDPRQDSRPGRVDSDSRPGRVDSDSRRAAYDDLDRELQRKQDRWEDSRESTVVRPRPLGPDARPPEPPRPLRPSESGSARIVARSASAAESGSARIVARSPEPPYSRGAAESGSARIVARSPEPPYSRGAAESGSGRVSEWLDHDTHDSSIDEGDYDAHHGIPEPVQREPSSPWLDSDAKGSADKRGSLRRAGRPTRKPDAGGPQPEPGTGTYRTGKQPKRDSRALGEPRDEGTRTGLRTGRRPKREG